MRKITIKEIQIDIETAVYVDKLLPKVRVKGYVSFTVMFPIKYTIQELALMDKKPIRLRPTQEEIGIWEKVVLEWMFILDSDERVLVWKRANHIPWKILSREYGLHRSNLSRHYDRALLKILITENQINS